MAARDYLVRIDLQVRVEDVEDVLSAAEEVELDAGTRPPEDSGPRALVRALEDLTMARVPDLTDVPGLGPVPGTWMSRVTVRPRPDDDGPPVDDDDL
ncbi:MAG: hypothetical protein JWN35_772 [Frankiales bacterium]|nr:hypothetical protein [Frankiales bacterium]